MDCRGKMWIITPSSDNDYERLIPRGKFHTDYFQEYSNMNNLGYTYTIIDYQKAPCEIALLGNLVIKTDDDEKLLICYIPQEVTNKQLDFINKNLDDISKNYQSILGYSDIKDYIYDGNHLHSIEEIKNECIKKHIDKTEGENKNVR